MSTSTEALAADLATEDSRTFPDFETDKNKWPMCSLGRLCPAEQARVHLRCEAAMWHAHFRRCKEREQALAAKAHELEGQRRELEKCQEERKALAAKVSELEAKLQKFEHQLHSPKTEKTSITDAVRAATAAGKKRKRGQQPGRPSPPKRNLDHLPVQEEVIALPEEQQRCQRCQQPFRAFPGSEDGEIIEIEVRAYRRRYRRQRYERC